MTCSIPLTGGKDSFRQEPGPLDEGETLFSRTWNHVIPRDGV